ncbi:ArnT family glycosyltransferase [Candidatus Aenigmatarchaeota archaeon]
MVKLDNKKILVIILVVYLILKLTSFGYYFNGDEIDTYGPARHFALIGETKVYDLSDGTPYYNITHPPLRTMLYSVWSFIFGFSDLTMRLVPIIFGVLVIFLTYLLGKELYSEKVGLIAAFLMTISRYFMYASSIVNNDNTIFIFIFEAAIYFFIKYKKNLDNNYLILSSIFIVLSFLTKLTFILIIPSMLALSYLFGKDRIKKDFFVIVLACLLPFLLLLGTSIAMNNPDIFDGPVSTAFKLSGRDQNVGAYLNDKLFYLSSFTWQATPFLAILLLISLLFNKRDKSHYFVSSWLLFVLILLFLTSGLDYQRYVMIVLPPLFLLIAKQLENFDFRNKLTYIVAIVLIIASFFLGLNDMMGFYNPVIIGLFYAISVVFIIPKKYRNYLLVGGFIALSLYSIYPNVTIYSIGSYNVGELSNEISDLGYPYNEVWATRDVFQYITPSDESLTINALPAMNEINRDFIIENEITYMSYYDYVHEDEINRLIEFCNDPHVIETNGRTTGFVCEVKTI